MGNPLKHFTIAIDGPGGAGKSSVAGNVARRLNVLHLDTGAMYRAFALTALERGLDMANEAAMATLARRIRITVRFEGGVQHTLVDGRDVSASIRTPQVSKGASDVAKLLPVRRLMVRLQQRIAKSQSMVLDGRDIGTRVLPDATLKIYLTASSEVRARRRCDELTAKGIAVTYETILRDVNERDRQDTTRAVDPLSVAPGAVTLDTSHMTQPEVEQAIITMLEEKQGKGNKTEATQPKREPLTFFYRVAMALSRIVFTLLVPVRYHGLENLSLDAPYILIGNHQAMIDPFVIGWKLRRYQIRFLGKKEILKNPLMRAIYQNMLVIPVDRHNMDMQAVRACLKTLREGHVLGIFPEGTRYKKTMMQEMESGIAMIALRGNAPILPAYITPKPGFFRRVDCYYGKPFTVNELANGQVNREAVDAVMAEITRRYQAMAAAHAQTQA